MKTNKVTNTNFQGNIFIFGNLSQKPKQSVEKAQENIKALLNGKGYDLYFKQDYQKNVVNIELKRVVYSDFYKKHNGNVTGFSTNVNIASGSSKYIDAAKKVISDYEKNLEQKKHEQLEKEYNKQEWEEMTGLFKRFALFPFLMVIGLFAECVQDVGKNVKKTVNKAKKIAIKKG